MKKYVTGFLFSKASSHIVLIEKLNPQWQIGLLNGVGGKIELGESSIQAMVREFTEETSVVTPESIWTKYANVRRPNCYDVDVYFAHSDLAFEAKTVEKEQVHIIDINELPKNLVPNLTWLIPLALDQHADFSQPITILEVAEKRVKP